MDLLEGWEIAASPPGAFSDPGELDDLDWWPARVPGTAAAALGDDGRDFDAEDWWFRTRFSAPPIAQDDRLMLELDGIATVAEVFLNRELLLESSSMWATHTVEITERVREQNELAICCRALAPLLARSRRPRQRWRTRIVNDGNLRWYRTMIFGRSPGYAPGPAPVGPWRGARVVRQGRVGADSFSIRTRVEGDEGVLVARARLRGAPDQAEVALGTRRATMHEQPDGSFGAELRLPEVTRWWPHTHGQPFLYDASLRLDGESAATRRVGFRSLSWAQDILADGLDLHVNGVPVFARGAVWTPPDLISLAPSAAELRSLLAHARDAGMNMLRVIGTGAYESPLFHDLCDELGILVWQDMMFGSLDYPLADPGFRQGVQEEVRHVLERLAGRPSLAVVCGSHELEQQPALLGLDPSLGRDELWEQTLPELVAESGADCAYVRSTPCGGELPFRPERGIAHYFGVGGYFRPPAEVRHAEVRFAAECLPFANVPDEVEIPVHHPSWKSGVQRDAGPAWHLAPGWDFDDARDFYFGPLFGIDPTELRRTNQDRYLELSRTTSGEVMAEVMGEWRRDASPCRGALMIWLKDMVPGAGFGVLDHRGSPKVAYHHLRRALAPVTVWTTDEGLSGVAVHAVNERPDPVRARLRVALYSNFEACVAEAEELVELPAHGSLQRTVEGLLGHFVDAACAYLFGPPAHDVIAVSLESATEAGGLIAQSITFPAGRPLTREPVAQMGIEASARPDDQEALALTVRSRRLAYGVRINVPGFWLEDDAFSVEPGGARTVRLRPLGSGSGFPGGSLTAINLDGAVRIEGPPA